MARTIPTALQTKLDADTCEYIIVLEVFWGGTTGGPSEFYGDKSVSGTPVKGRVLNSSEIEEAVLVTGGGQSQTFNVVLDDTKGDIKAVFDTYDVHKRPVKAWLYALGTTWATDRLQIFLGQINSPIEWHDGERTFTFAVVSRIEDITVGFSAEEGEFPHLPEELIGKPWPLCFGTTINVPALRAVPAVSGALSGGVGIRDFTLTYRLYLIQQVTCPQTPIGFRCITKPGGTYYATCRIAFETDKSCEQAQCFEEEKLKLMLAEQTAYQYTQITIFGGTQFPQGRKITLNIGGGLFTGFFNGTASSPSNVFKIQSRQHPDYNPATGGLIKDDFQATIESKCPSSSEAQDSDFTETAFGPVFTGMRSSRLSWEKYREVEPASFFWAGGGSTVVMQDRQEIVYIANIVPSTILRVAAWRTINGNRFLLTVPSEFYTVRQTDYNGLQVMEIVFQRPLSSEQRRSGGGWTDDIFVTQTSTVGPNTVDIIEWLISTYTNYSTDATSFAATKTKLANYPMHFPLLRRPNLFNILRDLARFNRCALWMSNDKFYIKYLSEEPTPVATITNSDILTDDANNRSTLRISLTKTEQLVTELKAKWRKDYRNDIDDNRLILRHNVSENDEPKYGTHVKEEDYFPFGHLDLVRKTATFWLIRWCNSWKRLSLSVSLEYLKLEPFDAVTINIPEVSSSSFTAVVERASLNTNERQIDLELWCPIRAGETAPNPFAWPANISEQALFPTLEDRNAKRAGSGNDPNFSAVAPPGHPLETNTRGVYQGISLGCNGAAVTSLTPGECRQDHGDRKPSDIGDEKPDVDAVAETGEISAGTTPVTNGAGNGFWSQWQAMRDWQNKIEGDAGRAREYAGINDSNNEGDGHGIDDQSKEVTIDRDFLDDLPDPDDLTSCYYLVVVGGFSTKEIIIGGSPICIPDGGTRSEQYAFDSYAAAVAFCNSMREASRCTNVPPCTKCISTCTITGPINPNGDPSDCVEGSGALVGFRGAPGYDDTSFAQE